MATSNIRIKKVCQWCGNEFEAQKATTQYCCKRCAEHAYKERKRQEKKKITETLDSLTAHENKINQLSGRDYLSVAEVAQILNVTPRAVYNLIYRGTIKAYRLTSQWAVIKRADIDAMIEARPYERKPKATTIAKDENGEAIAEFYTTKEIIEKFGVSNSWCLLRVRLTIFRRSTTGEDALEQGALRSVFAAKPEPPKEDDWISYSNVRAEYNLTHDQLHNYVKYHGLRRKKVGKYTYILKSEIDAILRPPTLK